jgi:hypothetical protein
MVTILNTPYYVNLYSKRACPTTEFDIPVGAFSLPLMKGDLIHEDYESKVHILPSLDGRGLRGG